MWMYKILRVLVPIFVGIFYPYKLHRKERLKRNQPGLFICNHFAKMDIAYVAFLERKPIHFIGKRGIFENKIGKWFFPKVGVIPVNRDNNDFTAIMQGLRVLKQGKKLAVFPEGTRNKTDKPLLDIKGGAGIFAIKSKTPIQPVIIYKKARIFKRTHIIVGETFELDNYYNKKLSSADFDAIGDILKTKLLDLRAELTEILSKKKGK